MSHPQDRLLVLDNPREPRWVPTDHAAVTIERLLGPGEMRVHHPAAGLAMWHVRGSAEWINWGAIGVGVQFAPDADDVPIFLGTVLLTGYAADPGKPTGVGAKALQLLLKVFPLRSRAT